MPKVKRVKRPVLIEKSSPARELGWQVHKLALLESGCVVLAIADQLGLPISVVGLGEGLEDWEAFDPEIFARGLFE